MVIRRPPPPSRPATPSLSAFLSISAVVSKIVASLMLSTLASTAFFFSLSIFPFDFVLIALAKEDDEDLVYFLSHAFLYFPNAKRTDEADLFVITKGFLS